MQYWDLIEKKYDHMGSCQYADDAVEMMNEFKKYESYLDVQICRYKRSPGEEDAYAILCLHEVHTWDLSMDDIL